MTPLLVGPAPDGSDVYRLTLDRDGLSASILTFGATLQDLRLQGHPFPLVLGHPDATPYFTNPNYFGATVGRYANRIRNGQAMIGGRQFQLNQNTAAGHLLHGGTEGTSHLNWAVANCAPDMAELTITLPDGHMGFPGRMQARVVYRLVAGQVLEVAISATTDATTLCSFAHHSYFNLNGRASLAGHDLQVFGEHYLPVDDNGAPSGEIATVQDTRFDLRRPLVLDRNAVFDHNFCLPPSGGQLRAAAILRGMHHRLEIATDAPGLQVYTGDGIISDDAMGLNGYRYGPRAGIALEPQIWPDAPNHAGFPSAELRPDQTYQQRTQFRFRAR